MIKINDILECEKYLSDVDAVVFDLDDTLYSEKDYVRSGYIAVARKFPEVENMAEKLWSAFEKKLPSIDFVLEKEGLLNEANKALALEAYRFQTPVISLYPGVREFLMRLKKTKKLGLITDGRPEGQRAKIEALGIADLFDSIVVTDELGGAEFRKPCVRAFEITRERLGISFEKMIYVGDNVVKDFVAPEKLGMQSCHFQNPDGLYFGK